MGDFTSNLGYRYYPNALCLEVGTTAAPCRRRSGFLRSKAGVRAMFCIYSSGLECLVLLEAVSYAVPKSCRFDEHPVLAASALD